MKKSALLFVLFFAANLFAEEQAASLTFTVGDKPVYCKAEHLEYLWEKRVMKATGTATIQFETVTITADELEWDMTTDDVKAKGNITLKEKENEISAKSGTYNLSTKTGILEEVRVISKPWFLSGEDINKHTEKDVYFNKGEMTTCKYADSPHYHLYSRKINVVLDEKIEASNVFFYVDGIPLFWIPYMSRSLKDKRSPLSIKPGYNTTDGFTIKTSYNYYFSSLMNGEIYYDYFERRGNGFGAQPTYEIGEGSGKGKVYAYYFRDRILNSSRLQINFDHTQLITENLSAVANVNYFSDETIGQDISAIPTVSRAIRSYGAFTYTNPIYTVTASVEEGDSWDATEKRYRRTYQTFPQLAFRTSSQQLWLKTLYGSYSTTATRSWRAASQDAGGTIPELYYWTVLMNPVLTNAINVTRRATVSTTISWQTTWDERPDFKNAELPFLHVYDLTNTLHYKWNIFWESDLSHILRQRVNQVTPDQPSYKYKGVETNKLAARAYFRWRDRITMSTGSGYDLRSDDEQIKRFDPISMENRLRMGERLEYALNLQYNLFRERITSVDSYITGEIIGGSRINLGINFQPDSSITDIYGNLTVPFFEMFNIDIGGRYDAVKAVLKEQRWSIRWNFVDCWYLTVSQTKQGDYSFIWFDIRLSAFPGAGFGLGPTGLTGMNF